MKWNIEIKKQEKEHNEFKFVGYFTLGKLLAMQHALECYTASGNSPIGQELLDQLNDALEKAQLK